MPTTLVGLAVTAGLLASSTLAWAGKIVTPPLSRSNTLNQRVRCLLANTTDKTIGPYSITVVTNLGGEAVSVSGFMTPPGTINVLTASEADFGITDTLRCEVEGSGISKRKTPVTFCVIPQTDANCLATVSVP